MRTARLLSVSPSMHWSGGVPGPWGVYLVPEGCTWFWGCTWSWGGGVPGPGEGVYLVLGDVPGPRGCTWSRGGVAARGYLPRYPPVNRMTDRCKNITLPQTSFAGDKDTDTTANVKVGGRGESLVKLIKNRNLKLTLSRTRFWKIGSKQKKRVVADDKFFLHSSDTTAILSHLM